jgi:hypothetical protein
MRPVFVSLPQQLSKKGVGPGKPFSGKLTCIIFVKSFVHKTGASMRLL